MSSPRLVQRPSLVFSTLPFSLGTTVVCYKLNILHTPKCAAGVAAGAHGGGSRAGGLAVAELELEATHRGAYALILSLGSSLPMRPSNCKLKRELKAGLNSA